MDNSKPFISVLIPSLNSQDYIRQCVESVCRQSLREIEIICIDAGSSDKTLDILNGLAKEDSRIRILNSDKRSYGYQMNMGLDNALGRYISIVESDDYIEENMLKDLYDLALEYDCDIAKATFYHVFEDSKKVNNAKRSIKTKKPFKLIDQPKFLNSHPSIWAGIYNAGFLKENNIRFLEADGAGWVDNPFFYQTAFAAKSIVYRHVPYYHYRESNPNSSSNNLEDYAIPVRRMMDNLDIVEKYGCSDEEILKQVYIRAFAYINNIFQKEGHENHMDELRPLIREMLLRLDENIILKHLKQKWIDMYYQYVSPIRLIDSNKPEIIISKKDFDLMVKENTHLYSQIDKYKSLLAEKDDEIKSYKQEMDLIKESKAYKLIVNPFRKLK